MPWRAQAPSEADPLNAAPTPAFSFHLLPVDHAAPGTCVLQAKHAQRPGRAGSARYGHETRRAAHCSLSMSMSFSSKSLMRSWLAASNMNVTESPWSSACAKFSALSFQHVHVCFDLTYSRDATFTSCRCCHLLVGTCYEAPRSLVDVAATTKRMACVRIPRPRTQGAFGFTPGREGGRPAFMVRMSSLPMHLRILAMLLRLTPMLRLRSQRKCSKPSERSCRCMQARSRCKTSQLSVTCPHLAF